MKARFDRQEYLAFEEIFEVGRLDDVTKELCEFSDDIEDMAYELAYTRYALAKAEARRKGLVEAVAWLREVDDTREWLMEFPWLRKWSGLDQCISEARAEVDRLIGGE